MNLPPFFIDLFRVNMQFYLCWKEKQKFFLTYRKKEKGWALIVATVVLFVYLAYAVDPWLAISAWTY